MWGAFLVWEDFRNGLDNNIYAQRLHGAGSAQWTDGGIGICTASEGQINPQIVSDGGSGVFIAYSDRRGSSFDLYAQHTGADAIPLWISGGLQIDLDNEDDFLDGLVADGLGGIVASVRRATPDWEVCELVAYRFNEAGDWIWTYLGGDMLDYGGFQVKK